jgi:pimeloyl-ACP methyl ester carboxylesterase
VIEQAVCFGTASALVGVITEASGGDGECRPEGVILLNAGLVHRVGPHRLYVELARRLAAVGFTTLRFDFSGIGDSEARQDSVPFNESSLSETREAMDALDRGRGVDRYVLMGLCGGALSAFNGARIDGRVVGAVLINPQDYDQDVSSLADARRYWRRVLSGLTEPSRWVSAFPRYASCRAMVGQLGRLLSRAPAANSLREQFQGLIERGVNVLVVFSSARQRGVAELETIMGGPLRQLPGSNGLRIVTIGNATHTFDDLRHQTQLLDAIVAWMYEVSAQAGRPW